MPQIQNPPHDIVAATDTGSDLTAYYNKFMHAFISMNAGQTPPGYAESGTIWFDTSTNENKLKVFYGDWHEVVTKATTSSTIDLSLIPDAAVGGVRGIVSLVDSVTSSSVGTAATPKSVKEAYDAAVAAQNTADGKADKSHVHTAAQISTGVLAEARLPYAVPGTTSTSKKGAVRLVWSASSKTLNIYTH
ncbi:phage tail protein [Vibrio breoganii]|uniref:phage tail protein n=1 Tax=Vibrio breoganii TaxID=553239 RepID=UPI000C82134B|nr:phage tail protein [Vibrio breoganii]PMK30672.1 hypothetical protein BCU03_09660 [Vibrio breoganii]